MLYLLFVKYLFMYSLFIDYLQAVIESTMETKFVSMRIIMGWAKENELDLKHRFYVHKSESRAWKRTLTVGDGLWNEWFMQLSFSHVPSPMKDSCLRWSGLSIAVCLILRMVPLSESKDYFYSLVLRK